MRTRTTEVRPDAQKVTQSVTQPVTQQDPQPACAPPPGAAAPTSPAAAGKLLRQRDMPRPVRDVLRAVVALASWPRGVARVRMAVLAAELGAASDSSARRQVRDAQLAGLLHRQPATGGAASGTLSINWSAVARLRPREEPQPARQRAPEPARPRATDPRAGAPEPARLRAPDPCAGAPPTRAQAAADPRAGAPDPRAGARNPRAGAPHISSSYLSAPINAHGRADARGGGAHHGADAAAGGGDAARARSGGEGAGAGAGDAGDAGDAAARRGERTGGDAFGGDLFEAERLLAAVGVLRGVVRVAAAALARPIPAREQPATAASDRGKRALLGRPHREGGLVLEVLEALSAHPPPRVGRLGAVPLGERISRRVGPDHELRPTELAMVVVPLGRGRGVPPPREGAPLEVDLLALPAPVVCRGRWRGGGLPLGRRSATGDPTGRGPRPPPPRPCQGRVCHPRSPIRSARAGAGGADHSLTAWIIAFDLPEAVLLALIGSTTANVIGLFVIVARYLFPKTESDNGGKKS